MQRRCRRGEHCRDHEVVDGKREGRQVEAEDGLCLTCQREVERAIAELPADYVELNIVLGHGSTVGGEPVRMTRELPIPLRQHIEAHQRDMVHEATLWAESAAEVLRVDWAKPGNVRAGWQLDRACTLLAGSPSVLYALRDIKHEVWSYGQLVPVERDGLDGALRLLALHHRARAFLGKTKLTIRRPVPCPSCQAMALEREDGSDITSCAACGQHYTEHEYEQRCLMWIAWHEAA